MKKLINIEEKAASLGIEKEEYTQLLKIFISTSEKELVCIKNSLQTNNISEASSLLHSVMGAAVSLDLKDLAAKTRVIKDNLTISSINTLLGQVQELIRDIDSLIG